MPMNRRFFLAALPLALAGCQTASDLAPALTQAAVAGIAAGQDRLMFSTITVRTTGTSFEGILATNYRATLQADLQAALTEELSDRISPLGLPLTVDVTRLAVAGIATTAFGEGDSALTGTVTVKTAAGAVHAQHTITAGAGRTEALASAVLGGGGSGEAIYRRMLTGFAEDTREALVGRRGIGAQILSGMAG